MLSKLSIGKFMTQEQKDKISNTLKGKMPKFIPNNKGRWRTPEQRRKYSKVFRQNYKDGTRTPWNKGKSGYSLASKGKKRPNMMGENHFAWTGVPRNLSYQIRTCFEYRQWRSDVFHRDNFICQDCGVHNGLGKRIYFEAHHKKPFTKIIRENNVKILEDALACIELWDINNGQTLCNKCHNKTKKKEHGQQTN